MSAPRAGKLGGVSRGRGNLGRANSPRAGEQHDRRAKSPTPRGGRQNTAARSRGPRGSRGGVSVRGRGNLNGNQRGGPSNLSKVSAVSGQHPTGKDIQAQNTFALTGSKEWRAPANARGQEYLARIKQLYETLKARRKDDRLRYIREGKMSDPEKKAKLSDAITPVGTCQDMCPEYERITRIYDGTIKPPEKTRLDGYDESVPDEAKMIKRFQRSAAGDSEQLPSDLRPPPVLQRTLDYIIDRHVNRITSSGTVQEFVWDRTRAIRNDFSIQQVTKKADIELAIDCFEKIARIHILALHDTTRQQPKPGVDHSQEIEQLTNTLTSLLKYYDQNRSRYQSKNEAEFRAYYIVREISQDLRPDVETRIQHWPIDIQRHPKVRTAVRLYQAAADVCVGMGPLMPKWPATIAEANGSAFWSVINSSAVSFLTACCAETYFRWIRDSTLESIWRAFRRPSKVKAGMLTLGELTVALGFDEDDQTRSYCEALHFNFEEREDGELVIDLNSVPPNRPHLDASDRTALQVYNFQMVEGKRHGRMNAAIIRGYSITRARDEGLLEESDEMETEARGASRQAINVSNQNVFSTLNQPMQPAKTQLPFSQSPFSQSPFASKAQGQSDNIAANPFLQTQTPAQGSAATSGLFSGIQNSQPSNPFASVSTAVTPAFPTTNNNSSAAPLQNSNPFSFLTPSINLSPKQNAPTTNHEIASRIFSTPSQAVLPTKASDESPDSAPKLFTSQAIASKPGLFPNPFQQTLTPDQDPPTTNQKPLPTANPFASILSSAPTPNAGMGTSLFSKPQSSANPFATSQAGSVTNAQASPTPESEEVESESLFVPQTGLDAGRKDSAVNGPSSAPAIREEASIAPSATASAPSLNVTSAFPDSINSAAPVTRPETFLSVPTTGAGTSATGTLGTSPPPSLAGSSQMNGSVASAIGDKQLKPAATAPPLFTGSPKIANNPSLNPFASNTSTQKHMNNRPLFPSPLSQSMSNTPSADTVPSEATKSSNATQVGSSTKSVPNAPVFSAPRPTSLVQDGRNAQSSAVSSASVGLDATPSRAELIDKLVRAFVLGPGGIMSQFIESETSQIVASCIRKIDREKERTEIATARRYLLTTKYTRRWREIAWKRKLRKSAKERRAEFRKSLHELALSSRASSRAASIQPESRSTGLPATVGEGHRTMAPPPMRMSTKGRSAVPSISDQRVLEYDPLSKSIKQPTGEAATPSPRAKKAGSRLSSVSSGKISKSSRYSQSTSSMMGEIGMRNERLMKEASRLIDGRTDTTRSDFFKLKALGLDPNTPIVPLTRKRRSDQEIETGNRKSRHSPAKGVPMSDEVTDFQTPSIVAAPIVSVQTSGSHSAHTSKDDEDLFNQIQAVKEALTETETWYREYREQSERTTADVANETEKQKRLREWRPSVSRTEARRRRDGLPSFLRSSYTPRETMSREQSTILKKESVSSAGDATDTDSQRRYGEDSEETYDESFVGQQSEHGKYANGDYGDADEDDYEEGGEDDEGMDSDEEEIEDGDDYDTPGYGGSHFASINAGSAFAAKGATEDDAISL